MAGTNQLVLADGKLGIGTSSPDTKLQVVGAENDGATATLKITSGSQNLLLDGNEIDALDTGLFLNHNSNLNVILATGGGRVGIGTSSPGSAYKLDVAGAAHASSFPTSSDARLKTDVRPLTDALAKLQRMRGVTFEWNEVYASLGRSTNRREIGVIAQEVEAVFPELVTPWGENDYRAVDYGRLSAVLIEAVKELKVENDELKRRIEALQRFSFECSG